MSGISAVRLAAILDLPEPTGEQAEVIESALQPAVVIAGAGSGKTETMAARVVWLVANRKVAPDAVLGLTFTRKAAAELGKRIRRRLAQWRAVVERNEPDDEDYLALLRAGEPTVSTYAAYAGRLVAEHALRLGAEPDARLLSPAVAWQLADRVMRRHREPLPRDIGAPSSVVDYVLAMAGQFADHLVRPDDVEAFCVEVIARFDALPPGKGIRSERPGSTADLLRAIEHRLALLPLVRAFAAAKAELPGVDFGDQMWLAAELAQLEEVRAIERARFGAVLLDEYQDTGHAQIAMLHGLFGAGHPVTAVGDPYQSIYGWRGASAGNIGAFESTFTHADGSPAAVHPLATSFRNDRLILQAANHVAAPLRTSHVTVALRPHASAGPGRVLAARLETDGEEAGWLAAQLHAAWNELPVGARTAAVLVRRRAQIPLLADALQRAGLPVEIVGLGGLLTTAEVADVVATLRVLAEHKPGRSLVRLLTGARWRIGAADLAALRNRSLWLVRPPDGDERESRQRELPSLVEALDDPGPAEAYSAEGYRRLSALSGELRRLRRRTGVPLAELVAEVERVIGIDVEVAARPDRAAIGRVHLDRFLDEAAQFAADADETGLRAFLAYLDAAEEEENGLEAGEVVVEAERVQILTVHGAKGLEWDVVAVPGLVEKVFPAEAKSVNWTRTRHELPGPLRGDSDGLPPFTLDGAADRREVRDRLQQHHEQLLERHAQEERRLAYVALTRAKSVLLVSGFCWDTTKTPRAPSPFLTELRDYAEVPEWFEPVEDAANPVIATVRQACWPADPLGPHVGESGPGRRPDVEAGAALVRAAGSGDGDGDGTLFPASERAMQWQHDVDVLLAERSALQRGEVVAIELPPQLSVSQLVELERDPQALARRLRRPVPMPPAPWARRGTAFHTWLEQRWQAQTLLDVDELPGAADDGADDSDFLALREAFERSEWAERTPAEVEVPFEMAVDGTVVRGRMDAVFRTADGGWLVVDWKTGRRPTGAAATAAAVQLAAYRLAWARLAGVPEADLRRVRAAFHYVRTGETVEPAALLDAAGLRRLVTGS
ncbi:ATP-dependent helicase [Jatrophihabitans cynanchi]|uniref:DNA 3'-5' helicase n=1 Tax=Jatrophihabitans cynanchi TaxID=2944128 RepID=A0ABY7JX08_9ACTN|nr:ATP-dependent DNA helicase [Jatrophihabitans sp. SB3-54]WAX56173.1 ATP-dependent helicase [Jatrophihabitans sp. SB3-54]